MRAVSQRAGEGKELWGVDREAPVFTALGSAGAHAIGTSPLIGVHVLAGLTHFHLVRVRTLCWLLGLPDPLWIK